MIGSAAPEIYPERLIDLKMGHAVLSVACIRRIGSKVLFNCLQLSVIMLEK